MIKLFPVRFRAEKDLIAKFEKKAKKENVKRSELYRKALRSFIEKG